MKSKPYELCGKLFRYDYDHSIVEYVFKASAEDIADEAEWKAKNGHGLFGIDDKGYIVASTVGLRAENWKNRESRDEYLSEWIFELDEEASFLVADFERYELPHCSEASTSSSSRDYTPSSPWNAPGMSVKDFI